MKIFLKIQYRKKFSGKQLSSVMRDSAVSGKVFFLLQSLSYFIANCVILISEFHSHILECIMSMKKDIAKVL